MIVQNSPNSAAEQNSLRSPVYCRFGGITYPLIGRYTSKTQGGFYLLSTDVEGAFYGLSFFDIAESTVKEFESILARYSTFNEELTMPAHLQEVAAQGIPASLDSPMIEQPMDDTASLASVSTPGSVDATGASQNGKKSDASSTILAVADVTRQGIMGLAKAVSGGISYAFWGLSTLVGKREKDIEVSPQTLRRLESIRATSSTATQYVTAALEFIFSLAYDFGKLTLNAFLNTSTGKSINATVDRELGSNAKEIAGTGVMAVASVWMTMAEATSFVVNTTLKDAGDFVEHSFGKELGKATKLSFGVASDAMDIRYAVKGVLKKKVVAKKLAEKASKDIVSPSTQSPSSTPDA